MKKHQEFILLAIISIDIVLSPFIIIFQAIYPLIIFDKNGWLVISAGIVGVSYLYLLRISRFALNSTDIFFFLLICFNIWIISVRTIFYDDDFSLLSLRFAVTSMLFAVFSSRFIISTSIAKVIALSISLQGVLVATVRLVNHFIFPSIAISLDEDQLNPYLNLNTGLPSSRDLLLGSSISANLILCGMFALLGLRKYRLLNISSITFIFLQLGMLFGCLTSLSRFPMTLSILVVLLSMSEVDLFKFKSIFKTVVIIFLFSIAFILILNGPVNFFHRFYDDSGGRGAKFLIFISLIFNSFSDFFIGSSSSTIYQTIIDDYLLSDNSYALIATTFGAPFFLAYSLFLYITLFKGRVRSLYFLMIVYLIIALGFANSILWEAWVLNCFLCLRCLGYFQKGLFNVANKDPC